MKESILFLNNQEIKDLGGEDMQAVLHDCQRAYVLMEEGDVLAPTKCVMRWGKTPEDENVLGRINAMPGYIGGEYNMAGIKWIGSGPMNYKKGLPRASVLDILNDPDTKLPLCIADGTMISAKRTGAAGGTAMQLCAREGAEVLTICGAGAQGKTQLEAAMLVRPNLKKLWVYDIVPANAERFVNEAKETYPQLEILIADDLEQAIRESDIIITVTLAEEPFVKAAWIKHGALIVQMATLEVEYDVVTNADKIVVDFWDTIKHRIASTIAVMASEGLVKDEDISASLGEILSGKKTGRDNDDQVIYFNSVDAGILDLAVTTRCYREAMKRNVGTWVPYWV